MNIDPGMNINISGMPLVSSLGFISQSDGEGGYNWTLPTIMGRLLKIAEEMFGPRDRQWTPLGVDFSNDGPQIWYPGGHKNVAVSLSILAAGSIKQAVFELAHETIHLLAPTGGRNAPVIEEGLATLFGDAVSRVSGHGHRSDRPSYVRAAEVTQELLSLDHAAIRTIRAATPRFVDFTPAHLLNVVPALPPAVAEELCRPFVRV